jgi:hypothetical protein
MGIQFIQVIDAQPIGSVVCTLSDIGSPTYTLASNPGNLFALNGNQISINGVLSIGLTSIVVNDSNGNSITITFNVTAVAPVWTPGERLFTVTSPINIPLTNNIPLQRLPWDPSTGFNYAANIRFYFDLPAAAAPLVEVSGLISGAWGNPTFEPNPIQMTSGFSGFPDGTDVIGVVVTPNNTITEFHGLVRNSNTTASAAFYGQSFVFNANGFGWPGQSGPGGLQAAGPVATGSAIMAGALLKQDYTANSIIQHALNCILNVPYGNLGPFGAGSGYPPAIAGDSNQANGFIAEGQFMAIPKTTAMPTGLSSYGAQTFAVLQNYGVFVNDTGGVTNLNTGIAPVGAYAASSWTPTDISNLNSDAAKLIPLLRKVGYVQDGLFSILFTTITCGPQQSTLFIQGDGGNLILQVTRDSDSSATNYAANIVDASGIVDVSLIESFCSGTTGRATQYFTQFFGSGHFSSAGAAAPIIYQSGAIVTMGGQPAALYNGTSNYFLNNANLALPFSEAPYFLFSFQIPDHAANYAILGFNVSGGLELRIQATTGLLELRNNSGTSIAVCTLLGAFPINTPMAVGLGYNFSTGAYTIWVNGVPVISGTDTSGALTIGHQMMVGASGVSPTDFFKGLIGGWTVCAIPQARPQFVMEQYAIDFWQVTTVVILTLAEDNFVGTNGTLLPAHSMIIGNGWTDVIGSFEIESNSAVPDTLVSGRALAIFSGAGDTSQGHYQITLTPFGFETGNYWQMSVIFRYTDANNYLMVQVEPQNARVAFYTVEGGVIGFPTGIQIINTLDGVPQVLDIYLNGSSISWNWNGNGVLSTSNAFNQTATGAGFLVTKGGSPASTCVFDTLDFTSATSPAAPPISPPIYYVSNSGSNSNNGLTPSTPWQTLSKVNGFIFSAGSTISFNGGQTFAGSLIVPSSGSTAGVITFTSYGTGNATISPSAGSNGILATNQSYFTVENLNIIGTGQTIDLIDGVVIQNTQSGNTKLNGVTLNNLNVSLFAHSGVVVKGTNGTSGFNGLTVSNVVAHDNCGATTGGGGSAGIYVWGAGYGSGISAPSHTNITITNCTVYNNTGAAGDTNWTGSGIVLAECGNSIIEYCVAHDNGAFSNTSSGPVGIWTFDSTGIIIQFNEVYKQGSATVDGGGYDLDGGVTNSVIQYNYSHGNKGTGYLLYAYNDGSVTTWDNNTLRYNISENDGVGGGGTPASAGGIEIAQDSTMTNAFVYNNTVFNNVATNLFVTRNSMTGYVANNIFMAGVSLNIILTDGTTALNFRGNDYYYSAGTFAISWNGTSYSSFAAWQTATSQEKISGTNVGLTSNPLLTSPGSGGTVGGYTAGQPSAYLLQSGSPMIGTGLNLSTQFSINPGPQNFYSNLIPPYSVGAN